jgi:hypothetical protein
MPERSVFNYAVIRVVPHVEREEFVNVGVVLFCRSRRFLDARIRLGRARLAAISPELDIAMIQAQLDLIPRICAGGKDAGPIGELSGEERFRWITSPRSTCVQFSPVHAGLTDDPRAALDDLSDKLLD